MPVAVAAPNRPAVQAATDVAAAGGTAVDAAVAAMVVAMSTEPGVVSPLGGAFVTVWPAGGDPVVVDGNVAMPGRGMPQDRFGAGLLEVTTSYGGGITLYAGPGSVAVPGAFAALGLAHRRYGRVPWADVLAPAVTVTREGYRLGAAAASYLAITGGTLFAWDPDTNALLNRPDGSPRPAGDLVVDANLSAALDRIAEYGAQDLYRGALARDLAEDVIGRGGLLTELDLASYEPVVRSPVRMRLGAWDLATNPPPSIGGPVLTVMLGELARRAARGGWTLDDVIAIQREVLGHRVRVHDFSPDLEADGLALLERVERHGLAGLPTSSSTAHVSVVDDDGTACAITASSGYGSGMTVPGTGLLFNNCLGEPELNRIGLHALAPGTRLASNMAPTVGRSDGGDVLAVGSPGADRITTALMQVLARFCLDGTDLDAAIAHPRVHVSFSGGPAAGHRTHADTADLSDEAELVDGAGDVDGGADGAGHRTAVQFERDPDLARAVAASGLEGVEHDSISMYFGGVGAAYRMARATTGGPARGLGAAADARRESATGIG